MRTSRVSQETSRLVNVLSAGRRVTRQSVTKSNYLGARGTTRSSTTQDTRTLKDEEQQEDCVRIKSENGDLSGEEGSSALSEANTTDIEDLFKPETSPGPTSRKRKRAHGPAKNGVSLLRKPQKVIVKEEEPGQPTFPKKKAAKSRKAIPPPGSIPAPANWEKMYNTVKEMRLRNPTAPVDTMGCAELYWRNSSEQERRFHILVALMLSSQTKDTVTAVAMQRLHTQLGPEHDNGEYDAKEQTPALRWDAATHSGAHSTLTIANILRVSPTRLNQLIRTVGFHNQKTKYIQTTASLLQANYGSDIPRTAAELMTLPGVGPKMAYLCMSSAWGIDDGIGVDVHVHRITNMWGWVKTKAPEETRVLLEAWLPKEKWREINWLLVGLGQTVCLPVGKKCGDCALAGTGLCKGEVKGKKVIKKENVMMNEQMEIKVEEDI
ncbi:alpha,alpha-trehalase nth1 [Ophidiomyces ophidiicola]|nr:alpha,alpha-trehalase nth1 [Ophidiomyces ophidiicola]